MRIIIIYISLFFIPNYLFAQKNTQHNGSDSFFLTSEQKSSEPLYFINNIVYKGNLTTINPDSIKAGFMEGDSSYVARVYGINADTSLIRKYYGRQRDNGIIFLFTKDKVQSVTIKKLKQCLKNRKCKMLFKIDNEPLTDSYHKVDIDKIQMIKDFNLTHWNTGAVDSFKLFVIKSKK